MRLDVYVLGQQVAKLYREADEYVLQYEPDTPDSSFVSLAMPVRQEAWRWPRDLHPFFRQNLPEGYLLGVIRELFGPLLDGTDLSLLAVVGAAGIGRVAVTVEGAAPGVDFSPLNIEELLTAEKSAALFEELVRRYARSAVSGVVPKFLAPEERLGAGKDTGKTTLRTAQHIIKGSDKATDFLGFNEHYTLKVLARLNVVPVVQTQMSADGRILVVDRFDVDAEGRPAYGVEDACNLLGLPPHEKYSPSTERALSATRAYIPSSFRSQQNLLFSWQTLANYVVRNSDCHAKNIAVYYSTLGDVRYTPVYDVVTTQAYPQFSSAPGLAVAGRKTWSPGKALSRFCTARLDISPRDYQDMVEQLCESAVEVGKEIIEAARNEPRWKWIARQMVHAWNEGMCSLRSVQLERKYRGLEAAIENAGLGAPDVPASANAAIGRSEMIARPARKRT